MTDTETTATATTCSIHGHSSFLFPQPYNIEQDCADKDDSSVDTTDAFLEFVGLSSCTTTSTSTRTGSSNNNIIIETCSKISPTATSPSAAAVVSPTGCSGAYDQNHNPSSLPCASTRGDKTTSTRHEDIFVEFQQSFIGDNHDKDEDESDASDIDETFRCKVNEEGIISSTPNSCSGDNNSAPGHDIPKNKPNHNHEESWTCPVHTLQLPPKCSRHHVPPSSCLALVLDHVLSRNQCQYLIDRACANHVGFRYITEATHRAPDGTSFVVQIQNPNPHKLSIIDTLHKGDSIQHHDVTFQSASMSGEMHDDLATIILDELYWKIYRVLHNHPRFVPFQRRCQVGDMQGLNPRMRILRYDSEDNDRFEPHFDATTHVPSSEHDETTTRQSLITVLLYLNDGNGDDFEGGETVYLDCSSTTGANTAFPMTKLDEMSVVKVVPKVGRVVLFEHDLFHSGAPLLRGTKYIMRTDVLFHVRDGEEEKEEQQEHQSISRSQDGMTDFIDASQSSEYSIHLISDVCAEIKLPEEQCLILYDMDLLGSTCESFLSPGITMVKMMLVDGGMEEKYVALLVEKAIAVVKKM